MIYWAQLLHFYQPPTQIHSVLDRISDESYRPLIDVFRANPNARASININGVLTQMLADHGKSDIIKGLAGLAEEGKIEFTGTAKYHPILPLIPQDEVIRQIIDNQQTNQKLFGSAFRPKGFFPPEMCYSRNIVEPILSTGHQWVITSGIACPVAWPLDTIHFIGSPRGALTVFFRDDVLSNRISFREVDPAGFIKHLTVFAGEKDDIYVVTAMDAETYGHHIKKWEKGFLDTLYKLLRDSAVLQTGLRAADNHQIVPVTISELLEHFQTGSPIAPRPSSWSTTEEDIKAGNPYPLWDSPSNELHKLLWEHLNMTIEFVDEAGHNADNDASIKMAGIARELLDPALHSDQFWWASKRPHWEINMINRGLMLQQECLLNAYRAIRDSKNLDPDKKRNFHYRHLAAEYIVTKIHEQLFDS